MIQTGCITKNLRVLLITIFHHPPCFSQEFEDQDHDTKHYLLEMFAKSTAEYYVYMDSSVHLTTTTIPDLLSYQKPIIAPMCKLTTSKHVD